MKSKKAKVLHHAGGLTLVEHVVDTACALAPPERVFVVTGFQAELVEQALAGVRGQTNLHIEPADANLEDVFISLIATAQDNFVDGSQATGGTA